MSIVINEKHVYAAVAVKNHIWKLLSELSNVDNLRLTLN